MQQIVRDRFERFEAQRWRLEVERGADSRVSVEQGALVMDTSAGMTLWLAQPLGGAYRIAFQRQVLVQGQANDRLSDLNCFWAAHEPGSTELLPRDGVLESYDSLDTWYVGMGGNGNTTTRFRRYDGSERRPLLGEWLDAGHLLKAGHEYHIVIEVRASGTSFWVDGERVFHQALDGLPAPGFFGFRSVWSRQRISDFTVQAL
ncbi:DUF6250 domain-containing protein [Pseudomonas putida]